MGEMGSHYLTHELIDVEEWHSLVADVRDGASVEFLGIARGATGARRTQWLDYEAYVPMAEQMIAKLIEVAESRWPLHRSFVRHRLGRVNPGEISVLIGVQAPHRDQAFEACRFLIDAIKKDVPIWKKEFGEDGLALKETINERKDYQKI